MKHIYLILLALFSLTCKPELEFNNPLDPAVPLKAPTELTLSSMTETQATLQWKNNNIPPANSTELVTQIEQAINSGSYSLVKTVGANTTSTTINSTFDSVSIYSFRIRAKSQYNYSPYSAAVSRTLAAPSNLVFVQGGTFLMGSPAGVGYDNERPQHSVTLSSFYIDMYEVTYKIWKEVRDWAQSNGYTDLPSGRKGYNGTDDHPVTEVSWYEIVKWCNARSQKEGLTPVYYTSTSFTTANIYKTGQTGIENTWVNWSANGYRLPTEAEWEYAARDGNKSGGYTYSGSNDVNAVAWYSSNSNSNTHTVGTKQANELGIYDMSGNVWEWCWDWYGSYSSSSQTNPLGPTSGSYRVLRGGSWYYSDGNCRVADRVNDNPSVRYNSIGFRVSRTN